MSWNATRFGRMVVPKFNKGLNEDSPRIWLSLDAVDRISDALKAKVDFIPADVVVEFPFPGPFLVGVQRGTDLPLHGADALFMHHAWLSDTPSLQQSFHLANPEMGFNSKQEPGWCTISIVGISEREGPLWTSLRLYRSGVGDAYVEDHEDSNVPPWDRDQCTDEESRTLRRYLMSAFLMFTFPQGDDDFAITRSVETVKPRSKKGRPSLVTIIDVKRGSSGGSGNGDGSVEHDHRWEVRGHFRNQPHGPGRELRKTIWIDDQVRGPEDKPILKKPRVYKV